MCGIAGILRFDGRPVETGPLEEMSRRLRHRGPDDDDLLVGPSLGLVHRRLTILDLTPAGHQPMWDPERSCVVSYNGEIYNFRELRGELEGRGVRFQSTGDTEVLLHACREWGVVEAARRFDGMFAFAFWDARKRELWLARDRTGIKPLYYHQAPDRLAFASEIRALLALVAPEPDDTTVLGMLLGQPLHDPYTPFRGIRALEGGRAICVDRDGRSTTHCYYSLEEAVDPELYRELDRMPDEAVVDRFAGLLERSVVLHLASDAAVASMASGGLDSSLVTHLSAPHLKGMAAYHADVGGPLSERRWAEKLAAHVKLPLRVAELTPDSFLAHLAEVTYANECPVSMHPNTVPFYLVCRLASREGIKVLLTGEGADELFGGYPAFRANLRRRRFEAGRDRLAAGLRSLGVGRVGRLLEWLTRGNGHDPFRTRTGALLTRGRSLAPYETAHRAYAFIRDPIEREFQADLFFYLHSYLQSILWRNDRMGMAASLESRVPFLENELIRHAASLPMRFKMRGRSNKWVLRQVGERCLPAELAGRAKQGFPVDAADYTRPGAEFFRNGFLEHRLEIGPEQLRALARYHPDASYHLAAVEIWGQLFFHGATPGTVTERLRAALPAHAAG